VIRDSCLENKHPQRFARLQSDLARIALRDYESALGIIRQLQNEVEYLKGRNTLQEKEITEKNYVLERQRQEIRGLTQKVERLKDKHKSQATLIFQLQR
jgi:uncharacterized coiled-coil protein SlyX